jgi:serine/threonine protein kinase
VQRTVGLLVGPPGDPHKYRLIEQRERGGEGDLWLGEVVVTGRPIPVAIKVLHAAAAPDLTTWRTRWANQVELLRSVDHPGFARIREMFEGPAQRTGGLRVGSKPPPNLYLVMNWVEGQRLLQWSVAPGRTHQQVVQVLRQVAEALDYLHRRPVANLEEPLLHRDVKPDNILIDDDGKAVLVDFGFTRFASDDSMTVVGTTGYWAPESQQPGARFSPASDRFAFGCTVCAAMLGATPDLTDVGGLVHHLASEFGREVAVGFEPRMLEMLDRDPASRPASCVAWLDSLFAPTRGTSSTMSASSPWSPPRPTGGGSPTVLDAPVVARAKTFAAGAKTTAQRNDRRPLVLLAGIAAVVIVFSLFRPHSRQSELTRYVRSDGALAAGRLTCSGLAGVCLNGSFSAVQRSLGSPRVHDDVSATWTLDGPIAYVEHVDDRVTTIKLYWDDAAPKTSVSLPSWVNVPTLRPETSVRGLVAALGREPDLVAADGPMLALTWRFDHGTITFGALVGPAGPGSDDLANTATAVARYAERPIREVRV